MIETLNINTVITLATIIFSAGVLYNKLSTLEKAVKKIDDLEKRMYANEADIKHLKEAR